MRKAIRLPKWLVWHGTRLLPQISVSGCVSYHGARHRTAIDVRRFDRGSRPPWVARWFATEASGSGRTPREALDELTLAIDERAARAQQVAEMMRRKP